MPRFLSRRRYAVPLAAVVLAPTLAVLLAPPATSAPPDGPTVTLLASGLKGGSGSTVGPDGALYVTEWEAGRVSRINPRTGRVRPFARGLPPGPPAIPYSGAVDVAFLDDTAYVLVTLVGPDLGGEDVVGIYRVDGPDCVTVVADIGAWSAAHPPETDYEVPTGAQYALEPYRGGFLVTDSHHNRVLRVELDGDIREVATFGNTAAAGLALRGNTVYVAEAGPIPHLPADGRVVAFGPRKAPAVVAAGVPLLVDVEFGRGNTLYALSNGVWGGGVPGDPARPDTGSLLRVNADGTLTVLAGLDRPCSLEFIGNAAYVVTLGGDVLKIDGLPR
ncbi:MAG: ScyD/ScyE family protein [Gemmataceae bacterium]|nr:ScyD/ScyE family protein [Gemmataceae bacterium]